MTPEDIARIRSEHPTTDPFYAQHNTTIHALLDIIEGKEETTEVKCAHCNLYNTTPSGKCPCGAIHGEFVSG
jgi:Fe-S-cluster-containing hydrogenase component 2